MRNILLKCDCFQTPCIIWPSERHAANIGAEWVPWAQRPVSLRDPDGTHLIRFYGPLLSRRPSAFFFTTRPFRGINHKFISREPSFRFAVFSSCLFLSFRLPTLFVTSLSSFAKCKTHGKECRENARSGQINKNKNNYLIFRANVTISS